jgi:hypothetical protein
LALPHSPVPPKITARYDSDLLAASAGGGFGDLRRSSQTAPGRTAAVIAAQMRFVTAAAASSSSYAEHVKEADSARLTARRNSGHALEMRDLGAAVSETD